MPDEIALHVGGKRIDRFLSYRVESDLYTADDAFSLNMANPGVEIQEGRRCELHVNGRLELTGIIDRIEDGHDKAGSFMKIEGRDLTGLLVDSCVEEYVTLKDITIKGLAERLLKTVPFINRKAIRYQGGIAGAAAQKTADSNPLLDGAREHTQVEPGQTVFDVLRNFAESRGAMFFCLPDGTFVFGRPKAGGKAAFKIIVDPDGLGTNTLKGRRIRDLSRRYSQITVMGQQQGTDLLGADEINTEFSVTDNGVPFHKPFVAISESGDKSPEQEARMILEKQRADGLQLVYRMPRHSQNGRNWTVNELCDVQDKKLGVSGTLLVYGRVFEMNKQDGPTTEIRLGLPGVIR